MNNIVISIIIPAYHVENYIGNTLKSIFSQNKAEIEVIVVNDGSKDNTLGVVESIKAEWKPANLKVFSTENRGVSAARNFGLNKARGEYVLFLDGDDALAPGTLQVIIDNVSNHRPDVLYWPYNRTDEEFRTLRPFPHEIPSDFVHAGKHVLREVVNGATWICTGSAVISKQLLVSNAIVYNENCASGEDIEFTMQVLSRAPQVAFTSKALTYYVDRKKSATNQFEVRNFDAILALKRVVTSFHKNAELDRAICNKISNEWIPEYYIGIYYHCFMHALELYQNSWFKAADAIRSGLKAHYPGLEKEMRKRLLTGKKRSFYVFSISPIVYFFFREVRRKMRDGGGKKCKR